MQNLQTGSIVCQANVDFLTGDLTGANLPPAGSGVAQDDVTPPFIAGCVPLNPFVDGASQVDAVRFITGGPASTSAEIDQRVFTANLAGELLQLPAGWIRANVGFENRRERANFIPGLGTTIGITRSAPFLATGGIQQTREFYGEVSIPLISKDLNIPFITAFDIEGSARTVRTGTLDGVRVGAQRDVQRAAAWEVGGRLTTIPDISFRGSYTNSIRLPSLVELFSPTVQAFLFANDPCDARFSTGGRTPDIRQANCQAAGIDPQNFVSNVVNATLIGSDTGNPNLSPERGRSFNAGIVIQPRFIERFAASFDLYNITIQDRIAALTLTQILNACFDSPDFPNDPICAPTNFRRDAAGQVVFGQTGQLNAASSSYRAVQATFAYNFDVVDAYNALPFLGGVSGDFGNIDFNVDILRSIQNEFIIGRELPTDPIGTFADPKWQGTFDTTFQLDNLRFFWRVAYQDSPIFNALGSVSVLDNVNPVTPLAGPDFVSANIISNTQGARIINNFSVQYTLFGHSTIQFGMDNVFNHQPDRQELALGFFGIDEQLGRRFTFRVRSKF